MESRQCVQFRHSLHGLREGLIQLPLPPPPFNIKTMEPTKPDLFDQISTSKATEGAVRENIASLIIALDEKKL